jgi:hypothetical protein
MSPRTVASVGAVQQTVHDPVVTIWPARSGWPRSAQCNISPNSRCLELVIFQGKNYISPFWLEEYSLQGKLAKLHIYLEDALGLLF